MNFNVIGPWGGYPKVNEASTGYLLEHNGFHLLIDCGSGVLSKLQTIIQPEMLDAVIISHYHADHIADIGVLQHARLIKGFLGGGLECLPIYGHPFNSHELSKCTYKDITKGIAYQPDEVLEVGPFAIRFLRTNHPVDCFGMRIEVEGRSLIYTADTSFKEEFVSFSKEADVLLSECNFYGHQDGTNAGHMTSYDVGELANKANVKQVIMTHLPHYGDLNQLKEECATKYSGPITLATTGLKIEIK